MDGCAEEGAGVPDVRRRRLAGLGAGGADRPRAAWPRCSPPPSLVGLAAWIFGAAQRRAASGSGPDGVSAWPALAAVAAVAAVAAAPYERRASSGRSGYADRRRHPVRTLEPRARGRAARRRASRCSSISPPPGASPARSTSRVALNTAEAVEGVPAHRRGLSEGRLDQPRRRHRQGPGRPGPRRRAALSGLRHRTAARRRCCRSC